MDTKILTEVDFIDGIQEFLDEGYVTELLAKNASSFGLTGIPVDGSVRFSGDTTLFLKQVHTEIDLSIEGAWYITGDGILKINPNKATSSYTYTYITYKKKASSKREGLFSVDYDNGILYTSTPIKDIRILYRYAVQYVEGQKMTQLSPDQYDPGTPYTIKTDDKTSLVFEYQSKDTLDTVMSKEYYINGKVNLLTLGEKDE